MRKQERRNSSSEERVKARSNTIKKIPQKSKRHPRKKKDSKECYESVPKRKIPAMK